MISAPLPEWMLPGLARRCQGHSFCVATRPAATVGLFCVGEPRSGAVGECRLCGRFFCGACAARTPERIPVKGPALWAWRLRCPRCGQPLADDGGQRAVIHSSWAGVVAGVERQDRREALVGAGPEAVEAVWREHHRRGLRELAAFHAAASPEGMIAVADRAISEAPGEPLAWLHKVVFCIEAEYVHATRTAVRGLQRCGTVDPLTVALLGPGAPPDRLAEPSALRQTLDRYAAGLGGRFNPKLAEFHGRVQAVWRREAKYSEHALSLLAAQTHPAPAAQVFLEGYRLEVTSDFTPVEAERAGLISVLSQVLAVDDLADLVARTTVLRVGGVSETDYYAGLQEYIDRYGIDMSPWPHMAAYLRYINVTRSIDSAELRRQVWDAEQAVYAAWSETEEERALALESARVRLAYQLLDHHEGKLPPGQLAGNVARDPGALERLHGGVEKTVESRTGGLLAWIGSFFKGFVCWVTGGAKTP